jgi:hypothetical protein
MNEAFFTVASPLRVSEVNYHPGPHTQAEIDAGYTNDDDFEFVEIVNTSTVAAVNLAGTTFIDGVQFTFGDIALAPGEHIVVARFQEALTARYGASVRIAGQYGGTPDDVRLSNSGERITLVDAGGGVIQSFTYRDEWYEATDGVGPSLVIRDETGPTASWDLAGAWRPSFESGGSPGEADFMAGDLDANDRVDLVDLATLLGHIGTAGGTTRVDGDLNRDGAVSRIDAAILARNFGRSYTAPAPSPAAVTARSQQILHARRSTLRPIDARGVDVVATDSSDVTHDRLSASRRRARRV